MAPLWITTVPEDSMADFQLNLTKITSLCSLKVMDKFVTRVTDTVYKRNLRINSIMMMKSTLVESDDDKIGTS